MDSEAKKSAGLLQFVAWAHANQKSLILAVVGIAVIGIGVGCYVWNGNRREAAANDALAAIRAVSHGPGTPVVPPAPGDFIKVANDYPNTAAAARALLMGAAGYFDSGDFKQAEGNFQRFMQDYPDYPIANQAQFGIAASLEAQGKLNEAATRYKEYRERHPSDSAWPQATSALARLYDQQGNPAQALKLYEELARKGVNDSWSQEAPILMHEILVKHPDLIPKPAPAPAPNAPTAIPAPLEQPAPGAPPAQPQPPAAANPKPPVIPPAPNQKSGSTSLPLSITNKP